MLNRNYQLGLNPFSIIFCSTILAAALWSQDLIQVTNSNHVNYMPSMIQTQAGSFMIVYEQLDASFDNGDLLLTTSADGNDWTDPLLIISGPGNQRHPALVQLQDGRFQLYYLTDEDGPYHIFSAESLDGILWDVMGNLDLGWPWSTNLINPTVLIEHDGSLTMSYDVLYGGGYVAHSVDGLIWDHNQTWVSNGALNRIMRHRDGTYVLSYQRQTGGQYFQIDIFTRTSSDLVTWTPENRVTTNMNSHDSFPLELADGSYGLFYARSDNNQPYDLYRLDSPDALTWANQENLLPDPGWDTQPHPILTDNGDVALAWSRGPTQNTTEVFFVLLAGEGNDCDEYPGDINADGVTNVLDIIQIINIILGMLNPTDCQLWAADVNEDEAVNILDIVTMVNMILLEG